VPTHQTTAFLCPGLLVWRKPTESFAFSRLVVHAICLYSQASTTGYNGAAPGDASSLPLAPTPFVRGLGCEGWAAIDFPSRPDVEGWVSVAAPLFTPFMGCWLVLPLPSGCAVPFPGFPWSCTPSSVETSRLGGLEAVWPGAAGRLVPSGDLVEGPASLSARWGGRGGSPLGPNLGLPASGLGDGLSDANCLGDLPGVRGREDPPGWFACRP